jgi:hypothetical protein
MNNEAAGGPERLLVFEDGVLHAITADGEVEELERVDVSSLDALLCSLIRIRSLVPLALAVVLAFQWLDDLLDALPG